MADTDHVLNLAAIIREVDGTHSKGAAALAESILDHPRFRAVLARWGKVAPVPVSASERLPGPEDCDANGRCWLCYTNVCNVTQWTLVLRSAILDWPISHWLPAHAKPLPEVDE